ncbi:MAG TPA: hypothetical protein VIK53_03300 [Verrucomicrobiae bacterium]
MKPLVLDQLKRRWFFWALFCLVHFIFGSFNYEMLGSGFIFPAAFILGPNIWLMDLQRGYSRVALTLPYTARQIGRTWWWISVGFAAILMIVFSFCGMTFHVLSSGKEFPFAKWLEYVTVNALLYGSLFWFFSGSMLYLPSIDWQKRIQRWLVGGFYLAIIGGCVYLLFNMQNSALKMTAFYACTLAMTIIGWLRAESMVADYGGYRNASQQPKISRGQFKAPKGFGGTPFIVWTAFFGVWGFGVLFLIIMNLIDLFIRHQFDWHHLTRSINNGVAFFPFFFVFVFMRSGFSLSHNLRFLRTMPVSTARLSATLLSVLILPLLTLFLAFTALAWKETGAAECISFFKIELLAVAPVSVCIAVSIWNTQANFIKAVLLVIALLAPMSPALYQLTFTDGRGLPFWFVILFSGAMTGISFWSTCQIIAKSSSAYHPRQNQFSTRWNWGR